MFVVIVHRCDTPTPAQAYLQLPVTCLHDWQDSKYLPNCAAAAWNDQDSTQMKLFWVLSLQGYTVIHDWCVSSLHSFFQDIFSNENRDFLCIVHWLYSYTQLLLGGLGCLLPLLVLIWLEKRGVDMSCYCVNVKAIGGVSQLSFFSSFFFGYSNKNYLLLVGASRFLGLNQWIEEVHTWQSSKGCFRNKAAVPVRCATKNEWTLG